MPYILQSLQIPFQYYHIVRFVITDRNLNISGLRAILDEAPLSTFKWNQNYFKIIKILNPFYGLKTDVVHGQCLNKSVWTMFNENCLLAKLTFNNNKFNLQKHLKQFNVFHMLGYNSGGKIFTVLALGLKH